MPAKTVLICDDDEGIVEVASIVLRDKGYKVEVLLSCDDYINKIRSISPSVILMDLWMPDIAGDEITRQLKTTEDLKHIPIIIVSANKDTEKVAMDAGADDFLCKPFDINDLEKIVEKYLGEAEVGE